MLDFQSQWRINLSFPKGASQEMAPFHAARGDAATFSLSVISLGARNGSGSAGSSCDGACARKCPGRSSTKMFLSLATVKAAN